MIGKTLSHYRILDKLGAGGMGEVYKAEDTRLKRQVALKVLPAEMAENPDRLRRFQREAELVASLNHPGIVTIYSVEEAEGLHFLTMELVQGRPWLNCCLPAACISTDSSRWRCRWPRPWPPLTTRASPTGISNRPMSWSPPRDRSRCWISAWRNSVSPMTQRSDPDAHRGPHPGRPGHGDDPLYGSRAARRSPVDHRCDIFSMGILLHEMVTGERPFKGESSASLISAILRDRPTRSPNPDPMCRVTWTG